MSLMQGVVGHAGVPRGCLPPVEVPRGGCPARAPPAGPPCGSSDPCSAHLVEEARGLVVVRVRGEGDVGHAAIQLFLRGQQRRQGGGG